MPHVCCKQTLKTAMDALVTGFCCSSTVTIINLLDENTAEALAAPPTPIVHSDDSHLANWHRTGTRNRDQSTVASEVPIPSLSLRRSPPLPHVANPMSCTDVRNRLVRREEVAMKSG